MKKKGIKKAKRAKPKIFGKMTETTRPTRSLKRIRYKRPAALKKGKKPTKSPRKATRYQRKTKTRKTYGRTLRKLK